ncbi:MAG: UvrD-helicase domain-containing protein [Thermodesulfobacteriota bacterium]|nr:UvrD-helicase domain-containing protein [Thermodesulfobacteriota bacterium]
MPYTVVNDCTEIDLNRHALIEASAGTGKTYMIERLVVRLLKENPDITLENILIVTYTEKATCELSIRIREILEKELKNPGNDDEVTQKIKETLDDFDMASIHTIHGFCHSILKDFAFENGNLFENEVIDDEALFYTLLKEQMRTVWPKMYGEHLQELLHLSGIHDQKDRFLDTVVDIARKSFRPSAGDRIIPETDGGDISGIRAEIRGILRELKSLMQSPVFFSEGYDNLNIPANTKQSVMGKVIVPLETYIFEMDGADFSMVKLGDVIHQIQQARSSGRQGIECIVPNRWLKGGANPEVCPNMKSVVERVKSLIEVYTGLSFLMTNETIKRLQEDAILHKRQNGWISYDDMLTNIESALYGDHSSVLVERLRKKFKAAFIDEFHDTDPVQWRIFRRIFLNDHTEHCTNLLYLIGDPKQAIYSFRGADIFTYLAARYEMERLSVSGKANLYSLVTNWRSQPELIHAFNKIFNQKNWFLPHERTKPFEIGYQEIYSPDVSERIEVLVSDNSHRSSLNIVDLRCQSTVKLAKAKLAEFVASEIENLITRGRIEIQADNGIIRALDFGDICILVRAKSDVSYLEPELIHRSIPYTFYKKPGLFLSDEALYLSLIFHAILDSGSVSDVKKALLTPFFEFKSDHLFFYEDIPVSHPLKQLLLQWNDLAKSRKWSALFQSLMEDSGFIFREAETHDWDRKYTNYRQIFEHLEAVAYEKNLDFRGLSALFDSYRKNMRVADDDADIHQIETDDRRVQIMTMHVSKGLEFPIVFIAGGFTQPFHDDYHVYHAYDENNPATDIRKIIDLSKQKCKDRHDREKMDEDKRLFYVALTRAQSKLYLPFYPVESRHRWVGPACTFLASGIESAFPVHHDHCAVARLTPDVYTRRVDKDFKINDQQTSSLDRMEGIQELIPNPKNYQHRKILLKSFSSLHTRISHGAAQVEHPPWFQTVYEKEKEDDESLSSFVSERDQAIRSADEIPRGPHIGSMFHDILENIDFSGVVKNRDALLEAPETRDVILGYMHMYRIDERWEPQICRVIADTLTTPIEVLHNRFVLGDLKRDERLHEVEFYYPLSLPVAGDVKIPECEMERGQKGFIRGFVDMVFMYRERCYIVDWKSNLLEDGYDLEAMKADMDHAGYHLQYKLYTVAVLRWLKHILGKQFDPDKQFGGIFYIYIRGMGSGNGNGIYSVSPNDVGPLAQLEEEINTLAGEPV